MNEYFTFGWLKSLDIESQGKRDFNIVDNFWKIPTNTDIRIQEQEYRT